MTKRAIVYICNDRLNYIKQSVANLTQHATCNTFDIVAGMDFNSDEISSAIASIPCSSVHIRRNSTQYGVNLNNCRTLEWAVELGYTELVVVEDDILLIGDAFKVIDWYFAEGIKYPGVKTMCLHSMLRNSPCDPSVIVPTRGFNCWGWLVTADVFTNLLKTNWAIHANGWDWSLQSIASMYPEQRALFPGLSRARNIGERGVHHYPENFKSDMLGTCYIDESYTGCDYGVLPYTCGNNTAPNAA